MKPMIMRFALLLAFLIVSATELGGLPPSIPLPGRHVATASASIPPAGVGVPRSLVPSVLPRFEAARPQGYAIPADHPHPPLGRFKLTAYSGPQRGGARAITATGTCARAGRTVAVDPTVIPLGSRVYIEGVGERIAEDIGGGIKGHHIDLYLPTVTKARVFGVQRGTVHVLAPPKKRDS
jgi:3D (Asp-Asp-Asp) domain-containing protein